VMKTSSLGSPPCCCSKLTSGKHTHVDVLMNVYKNIQKLCLLSQTVLSATARQAVPERQVKVQKAPWQLLSPTHKTAEQLITWLPRLICIDPPPFFTLLLLAVYYLCIVTLHVYFTSTTLYPHI
jgi:hypothetical protein